MAIQDIDLVAAVTEPEQASENSLVEERGDVQVQADGISQPLLSQSKFHLNESVSEGTLRYAAMTLLARREHSRFELQQKLLQRFSNGPISGPLNARLSNSNSIVEDAPVLDASILENVLQQLADEALQSDSRFAEAFTAMRVRKGQGPVRIGKELEQRRVADHIVAHCLDAYAEHWPELAKKVHSKKYPHCSPSQTSVNDRAKQSRFLQYRGFTGDQIQAIWKTN